MYSKSLILLELTLFDLAWPILESRIISPTLRRWLARSIWHYVCVCVSDKPRFARDHARRVFIWAGKTHNVTCHVHAYPLPEIEWWRGDRKLGNNQTFHIFVTNTHSNLQVLLHNIHNLYNIVLFSLWHGTLLHDL